MNDMEKTIKRFQYLMNRDDVLKDIHEFVSTFNVITMIITNPDELKKMNQIDLIDFVIYCKEFNDNIKPLAIKYGILANIGEAKKEGD